jgi:hypothetical protein
VWVDVVGCWHSCYRKFVAASFGGSNDPVPFVLLRVYFGLLSLVVFPFAILLSTLVIFCTFGFLYHIPCLDAIVVELFCSSGSLSCLCIGGAHFNRRLLNLSSFT